MPVRALTDEEIEELMAHIQPNKMIPPSVANSVVKFYKDKLSKQLRSIRIYPEKIQEMKRLLIKQYFRSQSVAGTPEGIKMAQYIGENHTQQCLNTFHRAGSHSGSSKYRFSELINASHKCKSPCCYVYFHDNTNTVNTLRLSIGSKITELQLKHFTESVEVFTTFPEEEKWMEAFSSIYDDKYRLFSAGIKIHLKMDVLYRYRITLEELSSAIKNEWQDVATLFSPEQFKTLYIFCSTKTVSPSPDKPHMTEANCVEIYLKEVASQALLETSLFGIKGVNDTFFLKKNNEWYVETAEDSERKNVSPFLDILSLPFVDTTRTYSTQIWEIYETLGIEALRKYMIDEFASIMSGINSCHYTLLVEQMTHKGIIESISRYSMRGGNEYSLWRNACFEETTSHLATAGLFGTDNPTSSVSGSIICGNKPRLGTNMCELIAILDGEDGVSGETLSSEHVSSSD